MSINDLYQILLVVCVVSFVGNIVVRLRNSNPKKNMKPFVAPKSKKPPLLVVFAINMWFSIFLITLGDHRLILYSALVFYVGLNVMLTYILVNSSKLLILCFSLSLAHLFILLLILNKTIDFSVPAVLALVLLLLSEVYLIKKNCLQKS